MRYNNTLTFCLYTLPSYRQDSDEFEQEDGEKPGPSGAPKQDEVDEKASVDSDAPSDKSGI